MVTMAESAANWRNTHTRMNRMHSLHTLTVTSIQLQPRGAHHVMGCSGLRAIQLK